MKTSSTHEDCFSIQDAAENNDSYILQDDNCDPVYSNVDVTHQYINWSAIRLPVPWERRIQKGNRKVFYYNSITNERLEKHPFEIPNLEFRCDFQFMKGENKFIKLEDPTSYYILMPHNLINVSDIKSLGVNAHLCLIHEKDVMFFGSKEQTALRRHLNSYKEYKIDNLKKDSNKLNYLINELKDLKRQDRVQYYTKLADEFDKLSTQGDLVDNF